ncbi:MAG: hypothetical protein LAP38_12925 [Acidobacteriia bacterium]|nr:hypothetical protein [Terriglobia bacterium]
MSAIQSSSLQPAAQQQPAFHRAAINRANAQRSTGPRTQAGKQRSSLNALRHGLTSRAIVLPTEDPAAFQLHLQRFSGQFQPQGALEEHLVQSLASTAWRLNRIPALEADLLAAGLRKHEARIQADQPDAAGLAIAETLAEQTRALSMLSMNEQRLSRLFDRTLKQLRELQAERRAAENDRYDSEDPANRDETGFVLAKNSIDAFLARHALQQRELACHPSRIPRSPHPDLLTYYTRVQQSPSGCTI